MATIRELEQIVEAVLFASGDPVSTDKLAEICVQDKKTMRSILDNMANSMKQSNRSIMLRELNGAWQLCTHPSYEAYIAQLGTVRKSTGLTQAAYETLAIVAYQQPVTRARIEQIRGVSADSVLAKLIEKNLVMEAGRDDTPGKPYLYETTDEFLRSFGFASLKELPRLEMNEVETVLENMPLD